MTLRTDNLNLTDLLYLCQFNRPDAAFIKLNDSLSFIGVLNIPKTSRCPSLDLGGNYLVEICGSQQPAVAIATSKEREVALATDEMRGYPDKNTTGTHLAGPHCPFSEIAKDVTDTVLIQ